ncbi:MAG: hypothetical protein K2H56_03375 [Malacoplasma sp.]|nr:hypothetical protein [Malacoplasma sp.]
MKSKSKKTLKTFAFFCCAALILGSLITFITLFFNKPIAIEYDDLSKKDDPINNENNEDFHNLKIASILVNQTNVALLTYFDSNKNEYFFGEKNFQDNIFSLINKSIEFSNDFVDNLENYSKNLKFIFSKNNKEVVVNLYLFNNVIKQKKYKSFFKLIII